MENIKLILERHKLTLEEYELAKKLLTREPNELELGIIGALWSEHCSYKSSKKYLKDFPTQAPWVVQGPGENAGVIDIGDNKVAVFKAESHNHPSFIEPFQGAATGVGGILRDIFTMGARPLANMNSIHFGCIKGNEQTNKHNRYLLKGVVSGISFYGNCMGVPMLAGETRFNNSYDKNNLVNAFSLGIAPKNKVFYARTDELKSPIIYVGSKTGRDGLGGATMSSEVFESDTDEKKPTVQVGDPFTQKLLLEACMEVFATDYITGIGDMGAAGLTSSAFEMAARSKQGMRLDLQKVPAREENMTPYDFMLSESQERMLICARSGDEGKVIEIFKKYSLEACVIGEVTNTQSVDLFWHNEQVASLPIDVVEDAPVLDRKVEKPSYLETIEKVKIHDTDLPSSPTEIFKEIFSHLEVVDKAWIYEQYDSTICANSLSFIGKSNAGLIQIDDTNKAVAMSMHSNARVCYINPKIGAMATVAKALRDLALTGAKPLAITDCLNFANVQNPEIMWQFKEVCSGIKEACKTLEAPVVSGNVSLYNETNNEGIFPTPTIGAVGVHQNIKKILSPHFKKEGSSVYVVGNTTGEFGGSLFYRHFYKTIGGVVPKIDLNEEKRLQELIIHANNKGLLLSAKDVSLGGIAVALAKMAVLGELGFEGIMTLSDEHNLFSESFSRVIFEISQDDEDGLEDLMEKYELSYEKIGKTTSSDFVFNSISLNSSELECLYFDTFAKIVDKE